MKTEFPYRKEESILFGTIYRPIVGFEVKTRFGWVPILAYADSGADVTLLPKSFIKAKVAIALIEDVPYLLGREGIFDHFEICFKMNKVICFEEG